MIDLACILTTGGVILFYKAFLQVKPDLLSRVVLDGLLSSKIQNSILLDNAIRLKWIIVNELSLIFIVATQEIFRVDYVEVLLEMMRDQFVQSVYNKAVKKNGVFQSIPNFDDGFQIVMQTWESYCDKKREAGKEIRRFEETSKGQEINQKKGTQQQQTSADKDDEEEEPDEGNSTQASKISAKDALKARQQQKNQSKASAKSPKSDGSAGGKGKNASQFLVDEKISKKKIDQFDYSSKSAISPKQGQQTQANMYLAQDEELNKYIAEKFIDSDISIDYESDDQQKSNKRKKGGVFSKFTSKIKNLTGNQQLTENELDPVLAEFKEALMAKNVTEEIAAKICDSIKQKLLSTKTKAFTSVARTVKECLREILIQILTPKRNIDIIAEAMRSRENRKPYVIVFVGVNGVGKSTNLAKVAYLYKSQGFSVMIAACDNFRAGAVEQVKQHGENLGIPVFDRGYKDEPPEIAYQAIREATVKKIDVVLVDTAGRMQHNEPQMRALSRIVSVNNPDLIVFIGEALVGNDGVDQLINFNKAMVTNSAPGQVREIDAILISKFDTVDDKVGTALSLTSSTGKPIIFVGVGQKYTHLKKLNVNTVVNALLS